MKNLRPYRDKTEDQIREILLRKTENPKARAPRKPVDDYDKKFNEKFKLLQAEYALDMNDSNDVEALRSLVRLQIQSENAVRDIDNLQRKDALKDEDYRALKNLGDFQTGIQRSMNDLQDKLGISRKIRKEKQQDDVPKFISDLMKRGSKMFEEKTTKIMCPKCVVELGRFWLNFPQMENEIQVSLQCWKCHEKIEYAK
jgi:hypothetical protein